MQIINGGKPEPEEPKDTFKKDLLLTHVEIDRMLIREQISQEQHKKLCEEVTLCQ